MQFIPLKVRFHDSADPRHFIDFDRAIDLADVPKGDGVYTAGYIADKKTFSRKTEPFSEEDLVIKKPGTDVHEVPLRYERYLPVLKQIASFEFSWSRDATDKVATLLLEHIVPEEDYPAGTWHQENTGTQTEPFQPFHLYTVSDIYPSIVQQEKLDKPAYDDFHLKKDRRHMDELKIDANDLSGHFRTLESYEIGLTTGHNIHRADILPKGVRRNLLRVIYSFA